MGAAFGSCLLCIALIALLYMSVIYVYHLPVFVRVNCGLSVALIKRNIYIHFYLFTNSKLRSTEAWPWRPG